VPSCCLLPAACCCPQSSCHTQSAIHEFAKERGIPGLIGPNLGSCSWVGVAGLTLGGGFGWLGRYLGLTCDGLVSLQAVLADGSVVTADKGG
jgi:FAD/FMN-containing dehydrogenase